MILAHDTVFYSLDLFGIFVATVAATVLAKRLQLDLFGAIMISFVASVGGGTLRDLLLNRHPIFWLRDLNYLYLVSGTSIVVQIFYHQFERLDKPFRWFDALGLATFTVIGLEIALNRGMQAPAAILMGVMTAVMGGIFRDVMCRQIPLMLQKEIYLTAALVGGGFYLLLLHWQVALIWRDSLTILLIFTIRILAIARNWNLPDITLKRKA